MMWVQWKFAGHLLLLTALALGVVLPLPAQAQDAGDAPAESADTELSQTPAWLEPRGLSVLDLVGQVPEEHLRGAILVFDEAGVTQYVSGKREDDKVTINVTMSSYQGLFTEVTCLGRRPIFDEWPVVVPPSEMRIYSSTDDIADRLFPSFWYFPAPQDQPIRNADATPAERYSEIGVDVPGANVMRNENGAINVPANMGCTFFLFGSWPDLTATFVFDYPKQVEIEVMGSQTFAFHSYIGVGHTGRLASLASQMGSRYGGRHDKFWLSIPEGADYVWVNYPPSPVSAYATDNAQLEHNIRLPSSGTYRLIGFGDTKSVDHVVSMGLPLHAQWMDADLDGGSWLERTNPTEVLASPEYFVPPGIPYDPCMKDGGCPADLLDRIYNQTAEMTIYYYRVRRLRTSNLIRIPLRQVGPDWRPGAALSAEVEDAQADDQPGSGYVPARSLHLPMVVMVPPPPPPPTFPDDAPQDGCPCGWFDEYYRMLDVIPGLP